MKAFVALYLALDAATATRGRQQLLQDYFHRVDDEEAVWSLFFLTGRRLPRAFTRNELLELLAAESRLPLWMIEDCHAEVGDLAETISLLLPAAKQAPAAEPSARLAPWADAIVRLGSLSADQRRDWLLGWWRCLPRAECFVLGKLLLGGLRIGVGRQSLARALATAFRQPLEHVQRQLLGAWQPDTEFMHRLRQGSDSAALAPVSFFLASALPGPPEALGAREDWQAEWKWDGIRLQIICREQEVLLWSRGEEVLNPGFPELLAAAQALPAGCILDAELLAWQPDDRPAPFVRLQKRIRRKQASRRIQQEIPIRALVFDLCYAQGEDLRAQSLDTRRARLEDLLGHLPMDSLIVPAPLIGLHDCPDWTSLASVRADSRERGVEGLMLKRRSAPYRSGRVRGDWFKWKIEPLTIDAVMIYAQAGHGRRANLYTDYTFALWREGELVPIAKAYSGLDDREISELDRWIRRHTRERFGPVRSVQPEQVFELAFEGVNISSRHKSGLALRFPRIHRWRRDLSPAQADQLSTLAEMADA